MHLVAAIGGQARVADPYDIAGAAFTMCHRHQCLPDIPNRKNPELFANDLGASTTIPSRHDAREIHLPAAERDIDGAAGAASRKQDDVSHG